MHAQPVKMMSVVGEQQVQREALRLGDTLRLAARLPHAAEVKKIDSVSEDSTLSGYVGVRPPPGLPPPSGMPSHGSCLHGTGRCRPCMWLWRGAGCGHGEECLHCHLCPQSEISARRRRRRARLGESKSMAKEVALTSIDVPLSECETSVGCPSDAESLSSFGFTPTPASPGSSRSPVLRPPPGLFVN